MPVGDACQVMEAAVQAEEHGWDGLILPLALAQPDTGFESFGEVTDVRRRAELLDESLDIVTGLWRGQPFTYAGKHYRIGESTFPHKPPVPVNDARVPIWVLGLWPNRRSMARAVRYQGIIPSVRNERGEPGRLKRADVHAIREFAGAGVDIVVEGEGEASHSVDEWQDAGATWYIESLWQEQFADEFQERVHARLQSGPSALAQPARPMGSGVRL